MKKIQNVGRSWPTTIIAAVIATAALVLAVVSFKPEMVNILVSIAFGSFFILALIIAIQGKRKTLRELVDSWFFLP